jgi:hypothetical protein
MLILISPLLQMVKLWASDSQSALFTLIQLTPTRTYTLIIMSDLDIWVDITVVDMDTLVATDMVVATDTAEDTALVATDTVEATDVANINNAVLCGS